METKVAVVILNWNGWTHTLECLESVFRSSYTQFQVVVCDNASSDNSVERITAWCEGTLDVLAPQHRRALPVSFLPCEKPLSYVVASQKEAETGSIPGGAEAQVVIIRNTGNLGYAGGNNTGLHYVLSQGAYPYVWLLNNDTVVTADALSSLVRYMETHPAVGICGSKLYYYHEPERVQACGGATYNKWLGTVSNITDDTRAAELSYVVGASMMVNADFLSTVGLLNEEYFLYFEELDWATRAKGKFSLGYTPDSVVYHKEGAAAGTSATPSARSKMSDYYLVRNRLIFSRKYYPYTLPTIELGVLIAILRRVARRQFDRIPLMLRGALSRKDVYNNARSNAT